MDHTCLINKIIDMGVHPAIVPCICDFLGNRQQCVRLNSVLSDYISLRGGIPQGTKLGPVGFQILVNSAAHDAKTKCWKYVDDMTFAENRLASQIGSMQTDLEKFRQWSEENHLKLNPSKCQAIQVCFSKTPPNLIDLRIGTDSIPYVSEAKVLGLWLQSDLK